MNGYAAARVAAMLDHSVNQGPDLRQREGCPLREQTNAAVRFLAVASEADAADMLAAVVDRRAVFARSPNGIAKHLRHGYRMMIAVGGGTAGERAAAVDAEGGHDAEKVGHEKEKEKEKMHISDFWRELN